MGQNLPLSPMWAAGGWGASEISSRRVERARCMLEQLEHEAASRPNSAVFGVQWGALRLVEGTDLPVVDAHAARCGIGAGGRAFGSAMQQHLLPGRCRSTGSYARRAGVPKPAAGHSGRAQTGGMRGSPDGKEGGGSPR
jgi:hypothetical protein